MQFSPEQDRALSAVQEWLVRRDKPWFYLAGYAGTGKTTLAREFASGVEGPVYFGAFTGKAAHVLQQKGCHGATTIHRLIYKPKSKSRERLQELEDQLAALYSQLVQASGLAPEEAHHAALGDKTYREKLAQVEEERKNLKRPMFALNLESDVKRAALVVIDECSMVDQRMGDDLLSFDVPVLVLGDPAQLPPVRGEGFFTSREPDFLLTEIHRQAKGNPILRLATDVREGRRLEVGTYGDSRVMDRADARPELYLAHEQMLVGRNKTRRACNDRIRKLVGRDAPMPVEGDRLVCLRNNHEVGLLNGGIWSVLSCNVIDEEEVSLHVRQDGGTEELVTTAHSAYFTGGEPRHWDVGERDCFDFGYALTVHKSQGSQWDRVLIFDESRAFRDSARSWLYTAITRAAKQVTVILT